MQVRAETSVQTLGNNPGGCSTAVVLGLATQIAQQAQCNNPTSFTSFAGDSGLAITSNAVVPFIQPAARADLDAAGKGATLQINSALRTLAQQYLLYEWFEQGACGIAAAAPVGESNHEGGRAVDLDNWADVIPLMANNGWSHDVPGDDVHFDHVSSPGDLGEDVTAFQMLWNANHASDQIGVDGDYGPETETRLQESPSVGFPLGASCLSSGSGGGSGAGPGSGSGGATALQVMSIDGPDKVLSGAVASYQITLYNRGDADWSDTTEVVVQSGEPSKLYDAGEWTSPTQVGTLPQTVPGKSMVIFHLTIQAPTVSSSESIAEPLELVDGSTYIGTIHFGVTVDTQASGSPSSDGEPLGNDVTGGCAAGSSGGSGVLAGLGLALVLARRRGSAATMCSHARCN